MKKLYTTLVAVFAIAHFSYGQNTYPWPTSGNIGIGTTSPAQKLTILMDGSTNGTGVAVQAVNSGGAGSQPALALLNPSSVMRMNSYLDVSSDTYNIGNAVGSALMTINQSGNVGIGTTNPLTVGNYGVLALNGRSPSQGGYLSMMMNGTEVGAIVANSQLGIQAASGTVTQFYTGSKTTMQISATGNVGIGTTNPQGDLDIYNTVNTTTTPLLSIRSNFHVIGNYGMIKFGDYTQTTDYQKGAIIYESVAGSARGKFHIALENTDGNGSVTLADAKLTVLSTGSVGIGTTNPDAKLTVNGTIHSKEVKVDLNMSVPDYVFEPDYKLSKLSELKTYVDKNHHLPEIPSAAEMAKNGINLSEMNLMLLKKVEELTLYLIEKDKEIKDLKNSQQQQTDALKTQMELLKQNTNH